MALAIRGLINTGRIHENPIQDYVAAISAGIWNGEMILDLDYDEDCAAEMDSNFVVSGNGRFIEIQATGEQHPFDREQILSLMDMSRIGCQKLIDLQRQILE